MVKLLIVLVLTSVIGLLGFVGTTQWNKKVTQDTLTAACAGSLTTLDSKISKHKYVSYGEFHDYVHKRVSWLNEQMKSKKIGSAEFHNQAINLFSSYAPTSMKTCQAILKPSFEKCQEKKSTETCALEASRAFSFGLKLVFDDSVALKQNLDLSRIVAFDIKTAVNQSRPRMPASEKAELQNYAAFLK